MAVRRTRANAPLWVAVGLLVLASLFGAAPVTTASPAVPHPDHHLTVDGHHDELAFTDHAHMDAAEAPGAPDAIGDIMASRSRTSLVAVGLLAAAALVWLLTPLHITLVGRDPPRGRVVESSGRDVLTRLCISRR